MGLRRDDWIVAEAAQETMAVIPLPCGLQRARDHRVGGNLIVGVCGHQGECHDPPLSCIWWVSASNVARSGASDAIAESRTAVWSARRCAAEPAWNGREECRERGGKYV